MQLQLLLCAPWPWQQLQHGASNWGGRAVTSNKWSNWRATILTCSPAADCHAHQSSRPWDSMTSHSPSLPPRFWWSAGFSACWIEQLHRPNLVHGPYVWHLCSRPGIWRSWRACLWRGVASCKIGFVLLSSASPWNPDTWPCHHPHIYHYCPWYLLDSLQLLAPQTWPEKSPVVQIQFKVHGEFDSPNPDQWFPTSLSLKPPLGRCQLLSFTHFFTM